MHYNGVVYHECIWPEVLLRRMYSRVLVSQIRFVPGGVRQVCAVLVFRLCIMDKSVLYLCPDCAVFVL